MLDNLPANAKTLAIAVGASLVVGVVVYALGAAGNSALRGQITELRTELDGIRASQASTDQRLIDGDAQSKATVLRLEEIAARLDDVAKSLPPAPPVAVPPPAEAVPEAHHAPEDAAKPGH